MRNAEHKTTYLKRLKEQAEALAGMTSAEAAHLNSEQVQQLIHNLQIYQIELEMQNDELFATQRQLETSRNEYAWLYDQAPVGYATIAENGVIVRANRTLADFFNQSIGQLLRRPLITFIHRDDQVEFSSRFKAFFKRPEGKEITVKVNRDEELYISLSGRVSEYITDAGIHTPHLLLAATDITERKKADAQQARLQRELQQAQKMEALGQLTGGIAHDFNNILGIILGYAELALKRCARDGQDKSVEYLNRILSSGDRAKDLVTQMLAFNRSQPSDERALQLKPLIEEDLKMLRSTLPTSMEIQTAFKNDLPDVVIGQTELNQLLINLSVNARDAMGERGILTIGLDLASELQVECTACNKFLQGNWIVLSVTDTGTGIDPHTLGNIFNPFFTTKEVGKGTGMGLAVVYGIVHRLGGHLLVETKQNWGTTFQVLFPPAFDEPIVMPGAAQLPLELRRGRGEQILVLDDEPELASVFADLLDVYGYRVTALTDSQKALELFKEKPHAFALLITDQTMPGITGVELIEAFRAVRPDIPVILNTGYSEHINAEAAAEMGICYLAKPASVEKLIQTVGDLLQPK